ncbi:MULTISPECIES: ribose-phosphate diphosphokinase [unclassified Motilimonas]|uniref:ribose-phosphate diphosphokinase n=1 Tax=Motilimonas TaxID=1914248 RepID=UPI001E4DD97E|nr:MULTISPECIES: ribose-phosphate diphosphokinase [unclassified Motilimonas]MCE0557731.1 ribose-phosphate diphosphokinase [Motilimonas sp. E26]MDO6525958.1 ribose-phosphate diphosphokinase [Motilimonas sp. 1_MG-2023]
MHIKAFQIGQQQATELQFDSFTFNGGEEHVRITNVVEQVSHIEITTRLNNSAAFMQLAVTVDALQRQYGHQIALELVAPYFPYARQDRVCNEGEALGVAVMAKLINALNFQKVTIWDAHSDVTPALINNVVNVQQAELLARHHTLATQLKAGELTLIAPDAGAAKKVHNLAKYFGGGIAVVQAEKVRDVATGEITHTAIFGDITNKDVLITDDICDGGRTFIELAKVLKQQGAKRVSLFVTHGIFANGLAVFDGLIDAIYTSESFPAPELSGAIELHIA